MSQTHHIDQFGFKIVNEQSGMGGNEFDEFGLNAGEIYDEEDWC